MHRTRVLLIVATLLVATIAILVMHALGITNTGTRLDFQTIDKGAWSGHTEQAYYVIQNLEEWVHVWNQHQQIFIPQHPHPEINFSEATVIAVFMGMCRTTGHSVEVKEVIDTGLTIVVKVEKVHPGKNCIVGLALTYPYHIIKICKINKHVIFQTTERIANCG